MEDRKIEMENFINEYGNLNGGKVYIGLAYYGCDDTPDPLVSDEDPELLVKDEDIVELTKFAKKADIVTKDDKNSFIHFFRGMDDCEDCVKLYVSLIGENYKDFMKDFFLFTSSNNMITYFKIGKVHRNDGLTIRLINREDIPKVTDFINQYPNQEVFGKINPFLFRNGNVGYLKDGNYSGNKAIAHIISSYDLTNQENSAEKLKDYVSNNPNMIKRIIYKSFKNEDEVYDEYVQKMVDDMYETILFGLDTENKFDDFMEMIHKIDKKDINKIGDYEECMSQDDEKGIHTLNKSNSKIKGYVYNEKEFATKWTLCEYDENGYTEDGYDQSGYNKEGYDREGYDIYEYDKEGYDREGWNRKGINKETGTEYNAYGYDVLGYNKEGYDKNGYDMSGYDRSGYNEKGWTKDGIHKYTNKKYDVFGFDVRGFNAKGIHKFTGTKYNIKGYDEDGYNKDGYNEEGNKKQFKGIARIKSIISKKIKKLKELKEKIRELDIKIDEAEKLKSEYQHLVDKKENAKEI